MLQRSPWTERPLEVGARPPARRKDSKDVDIRCIKSFPTFGTPSSTCDHSTQRLTTLFSIDLEWNGGRYSYHGTKALLAQ